MTATVILCAGQSNALGQGGTLPARLQIPDANIKIWNGSAFVTLQNGVNNDITGAGPGTWWGPEAEFSRAWRVAHPSDILYIVKYAVSGTFLYDTGSLTWYPTRPSYFAQMTTYATDAKNALISAGKTPVVEALLWMQGESDGSGSDAGGIFVANSYQANLTLFFSSVRSQWGDANTKMLVGRITDTAHWPSGDIIRTAQAAVVAADLGQSALIDTDSYTRLPDGYHYDGAGSVQLGATMFDYFYPVPAVGKGRRLVKIGS